MRTLLALLALVAVVSCVALRGPLVNANALECMICKDVAADVENYEGKEGEKNEPAAITYCENKFPDAGGKLLCDYVLKKELDNIIKHMEDPSADKADAAKECAAMKMC